MTRLRLSHTPVTSGRRAARRSTWIVATGAVGALFGASPALGHLSIGDRVWNDANNNGVMDAGEPGIGGVLIHGYDDLNGDCRPEGPARQSFISNAFGAYMLPALGQGIFVAEIDASNFAAGGPLAGFTSSTGSGVTAGPYEPGILEGASVATDGRDHGTVMAGRIRACPVELRLETEPVGEGPSPDIPAPDPIDANVQSTIDFGVFKPNPNARRGLGRAAWEVGDRVWNDLDRDGIQDAREPGVADVAIRVINAGGVTVGTVRSGPGGRFSVGGFAPGRYRFAFDPPPGGRLTAALRGSNRAKDSNPKPGTRRTAPVALRRGARILHIDAGMVLRPAVGGVVWRDANENGRLDRGESPLRRIRVTVRNQAGGPVRRATTNSQGRYVVVLAAGRYTVTFSGLPSYGGPSTPASTYTNTTITSRRVAVPAGRQRLDVNAGLKN